VAVAHLLVLMEQVFLYQPPLVVALLMVLPLLVKMDQNYLYLVDQEA
jgi:hypothetical protein